MERQAVAAGVTAALLGYVGSMDGPAAHADPARRWSAGVAAGATYLALGLLARW